MAKIAACLIVKNEEKYIERILGCIRPHVDGIFVYDTGSSDQTIKLAREQGAVVEVGEWRNDFAWARNRSYSLPPDEYDWIVYFDADDQVSDLHLLRGLAGDAISSVDSFAFPYHNDWSGIHVNYHTIRMVRRASGYRWRYPLHEQLEMDDKEYCVTLDAPVWRQKHSWQDRISKSQRNMNFLKEHSKEHGLTVFHATHIIACYMEVGDTRGAIQWMNDNNYEMDIRRVKCG